MKVSLALSAAAALLVGNANAFYGQMAADEYTFSNQLGWGQNILLKDYTTGSEYFAWIVGGFRGCVDKQCRVSVRETSGGNYNFEANVWRTADGCHNIDFLGALDAHHGYCCGSLPCNFSA